MSGPVSNEIEARSREGEDNEQSQNACVAGASGLVGSNIVKAALAKGYRVNGTMRDANDEGKRPYLVALPGAAERLTLFSADSAESTSFDAALDGADALLIARFPPSTRPRTGLPLKNWIGQEVMTRL